MLDIVALGEPLFELNQQLDGRFIPGFGGDTSNVTVAASRLGAKTAYITAIGTDWPGDSLMALWQREGIDVSAVKRIELAPTGLYLVTHGPQGHQFSYCRKGSAASLIAPGDVPETLVHDAKFLHVSAISQAISRSACEAARSALAMAQNIGTKVCFDTNLRLKLWTLDDASSEITATAARADVLKTSADDAKLLTGLDEPSRIAQYFHDLGSRTVIVTLGSAGVYVSADNKSALVDSWAVKTVDATGAGDAFTGAFLAELCRGEDAFAAARFANASAALSTLGYGAVAALPYRAQVDALLASG